MHHMSDASLKEHEKNGIEANSLLASDAVAFATGAKV
jgi:hypothetical protein